MMSQLLLGKKAVFLQCLGKLMFSEERGWKGDYRAVSQTQENVHVPTQELDMISCVAKN